MSDARSDKKSVMVIDDQQFFIEAIEAILQDWGYAVTSYVNPVDAISSVKTQDYDVVLCDLHMPYLRGDKLLFQLARINPELKCCLMTAAELDEPLLRKTLRMKNVHGFIRKPISYDNLSSTLNQLFIEQKTQH